MATLPRKMMVHSAVLSAPMTVTEWQEPTDEHQIQLSNVHVQRKSGTGTTAINTEIKTSAMLWFDAKISKPHGLNLLDIKANCETHGADLKCAYAGQNYTVVNVIECLDGYGRLHHYEMEMV